VTLRVQVNTAEFAVKGAILIRIFGAIIVMTTVAKQGCIMRHNDDRCDGSDDNDTGRARAMTITAVIMVIHS
jgi:hypothetical protein